MAKISIIVPVYNAEKFIAKTIESLLSQSIEDKEIILIDDGSEDDSGRICDSYAKENDCIVVVHQKNSGVSRARNIGLSKSTGEYVGFCDADDTPDKDLYEYLYKMVISSSTDIAMVDYYILKEDGNKNLHSDGFEYISHNREAFIGKFLDGRLADAIYTSLYRGEICRTVKFEEDRRINEDKMFLFQFLMKAESVCYKSIGKYGYYRHMGSSSLSEFSEKFFDYIYFMEKISEICRKEFSGLDRYVEKNELITYLTLLTLMCKLDARKTYSFQFKEIAKKTRKFKLSFCKRNLPTKTFLKWLCLKTGDRFFEWCVKEFAVS